jgi:cardiolipin-specific phospholipase
MKWNSFNQDTLLVNEQTLIAATGVRVVKRQVPISCGNFIMTYTCGSKSAPVMVLLHGFLGGSMLYYRMIPELTKYFKVVCMDLLGMGQSSRPNMTFNSHEEAENFFVLSLEEAFVALKLKDFVLVGHSFGGYVASCFSLRFRHRVQQLMLISPAGLTNRGEEHNRALEMNQSDTGRRIRRKIAGWFWKQSITLGTFLRASGPFAHRLVKTYTREKFSILPENELEALEHYLGQINLLPGSGEYALFRIIDPGVWARSPLCDRLTQLAVPISFYYGEQDWMNYRGALVLQMKSEHPVEVKVTENSGHHLYIENSAQLLEQMLESLVTARSPALSQSSAPPSHPPPDIPSDIPSDTLLDTRSDSQSDTDLTCQQLSS